MSTIRIRSGKYRGAEIIDQEFNLVKGFQTSKKGNFVTVENNGMPLLTIGKCKAGKRLKILITDINQIEFSEGNPIVSDISVKTPVPVISETDDVAMDRIATRFAILDEMSAACVNGKIRAMIVSGPPGVGKSYGVEAQMHKATLFDNIIGNRIRYEVVKGAMTALGLYSQLYKFSDSKNVLIFDDCDSVFSDELSLNILKAALDSGKRRKICWNSDSSLLRREGIPDSFDFNGSAIFITNLKFSNVKSKKLQDHLEALQSRCHFLDLTINNQRDKMLRIKQVHRDAEGGLFKDYQFDDNESQVIIDFMFENQTKLREISMRMCLKIADLVKISPDNWRNLAVSTCMKE